MSEKKILQESAVGPSMAIGLELAQRHFISQCLYAVCKYGIPDIIGDSDGMTISEIVDASPVVYHKDYMFRILRLLAADGVFIEKQGYDHMIGKKICDPDYDTEDPYNQFLFALSDVGALFQTGSEQPSLACGVLHWMESPVWNSWGALPAALKTPGSIPFQDANEGTSVYEYYSHHSESMKHFQEFMNTFSKPELEMVLSGYPAWKDMAGKSIVDIGGGTGHISVALRKKFPELGLIKIFDLEEVTEQTKTGWKDISGVELVSGNFFDATTIPMSDCFILKHILHDWNDEKAVKILRNLAQKLNLDGCIVIAECILSGPGEDFDNPASKAAKYLDLLMLNIGGRERSKSQWEKLAKETGVLCVEEFILPRPGQFLGIIVMIKESLLKENLTENGQ